MDFQIVVAFLCNTEVLVVTTQQVLLTYVHDKKIYYVLRKTYKVTIKKFKGTKMLFFAVEPISVVFIMIKNMYHIIISYLLTTFTLFYLSQILHSLGTLLTNINLC